MAITCDRRARPEGSCEVAVPHASVTSASHWMKVSLRLRNRRKRMPVKMVFI